MKKIFFIGLLSLTLTGPLLLAKDQQSVGSFLNAYNFKDINSRGHFGNTPLHMAIRYGSSELIGDLINAGADVNAKNNAGDTPLDMAKKLGRDDVSKNIMNGVFDVTDTVDTNAREIDNQIGQDQKSKNDRNRLNLAIEKDNKDLFNTLLKNKRTTANLDHYLHDTQGTQTLLHNAIALNRQWAVEKLLEHKVSINLEVNGKDGEPGITALELAFNLKNQDVLNAILKHVSAEKLQEIIASFVYSKQSKNLVPLHWSIQYENPEAFKTLLKKKNIDINAIDEDGNTPLHLALLTENKHAFYVLLRKKANIRIRNNAGQIPYALAKVMNLKWAIDALNKLRDEQ